MNATVIARSVLCAVLVLLSSAPARRALGQESGLTEHASLADWERRIAAAPGAEQVAVRRRFAAVRAQLMRDERVPQVLRLSMSSEAFRAACATEEARGAGLGVEIWQASGEQVIAAMPPASRRRLARAGITSEVLFESVADWQRARGAGAREARSIEPYYQSAEAARDLVPCVIVFDLSQSTLDVSDAARGLLDHESVLGRNASYLAYLQIVPAGRLPLDVSRRYTERGLTVAGVFTLAEFPNVAPRFFPEMDALGGGARVADPMPPSDEAFHTYEAVEAELRDLASQYPTIAKLISLGPTYEGRELWALKVSRDVDTDDPGKPDVLFTGAHHAREWISVEPPVYFAHLLTERYASDSAVRALVDGAEIWLVPVVNPDGLAYSQSQPNDAPNTNSVRFWRKNRRPIDVAGCGSGVGVDLNRNYPFMFRLPTDLPCPAYDDDVGASDDPTDFVFYRGPEAASELEVQHLIALTGDPGRNFVARVDFHNWGQLVLYPWGFTTEPSPEHETQGTLARVLAQQLTATNWVPYVPGAISLALYVATGNSTDYAFGVDGTVGASTWELRPGPRADISSPGFPCEVPLNCFFVAASDIDAVNRETWAAAERLIEWSIDPACSPASAKAFAYVANRTSNTVTVIDAGAARVDPAHAVAATVPVDGGPAAIAVTPDGAFAYVACADADTVAVVDTALALSSPATAVVDTIAVGHGPGAVAVRSDGAFVYVANRVSGDVTVISAATRSVTATTPVGAELRAIAVSPDGVFVYVTAFGSDNVTRLDTATNQITQTLRFASGRGPSGVTVGSDGVVYVTQEHASAVFGYAPSLTQSVLTRALTSQLLPDTIATTPDAAFAYVSNRGSNSVSVLDTLTNHLVIATIAVGGAPAGMAFTPDGAFAYVANGADGTVSIIDTATNLVTATIPVGSQPSAVAIELMPLGCQVLPTPPPRPPATPVPTASPTATAVATATASPTSSATLTSTATPTPTSTVTQTRTVTATATPTLTPTPADTATRTAVNTPTATQRPCVGDCGGTNSVAVNDLITLVDIALGNAQPSACANGVPSGADVNIALLVKAVNNALNGCGVG